MARIDAFLQLARDQGCSDVHLAVGSPPLFRHNGDLTAIKYRVLSQDELESLLFEIMSQKDREAIGKRYEIEFSYHDANAARYRVSVFKKISGLGATLRIISHEIPSLSDLNMPSSVKSLLDMNQGMILVTGATGTGKSTTLASMIDLLNRQQRLNIVTLEDPIEYLHESQRSLVVQREVGTHVNSYKEGLRAALREDPDVILVGELRDPETISMAMTATETGHIVLATLHTTSASKTLDRIIDAMPTEQKSQTSIFLAQHLRAVISQKLVRTFDGHNRRAIVELMINTPAISNLILTGKIFQIPSIMQTGRNAGMQLMDQALMDAINQKLVDPDDAYQHATDKQLFQRFVTNPNLLPQANLAVN